MADKRNILIGLGGAALVSVLLAGFVLEQRIAEGQPHYTPAEVLPGFSANVKNAALIEVTSHAGTFTVRGENGKGWVLPDKANYPADFDQVRHTLIGLAGLETIAPKTDRADWLHYLALDTPPKGTGTQITVKDARGTVLASLIMGNMEELGDPNGTSGVFVRKPGDNQAWLARTVFQPHGDIASWISTHVLDIGATRLEEVVVTPPKGPAFAVHRLKPSDPVYTLAAPPKGATPNSQAINAIAYAVNSFSLTDVQPAAKLDFSKASHAVARTFDGLLVTFDFVEQGGGIWAKLAASTVPGTAPMIGNEANAINARTAGWAYKLPPEKGAALLSDLAKLTAPPPAPQGPQGMPGGLPPGMAGMMMPRGAGQ
jgi:Domain of unknown function (DUF4340)